MTVLNLHAPDVSFPARTAAQTSAVLSVDGTGSGCTNRIKNNINVIFVYLGLRAYKIKLFTSYILCIYLLLIVSNTKKCVL